MIGLTLTIVIGLALWGGWCKLRELRAAHGTHNLVFRALTMRPLTGPTAHKTDATFWAQSTDRATGRSRGRHHRAGAHNLALSLGGITAVVACLYGLAEAKTLTLACLGGVALALASAGAVIGVRRARRAHSNRGIIAPLAAAMEQITDPDRSLDTHRGSMFTMEAGWLTRKSGLLGTMALPDTFHANDGQKAAVEKLISARLPVPVRFAWQTSRLPQVVRILAAPPLPALVRFRNYVDEFEGLPPGVFAVGVDSNGDVYTESHNGDTPWTARSMNSGTGKSTGFMVKAAQIARKDPGSRIVCVDTKQVSFAPLRGIRLDGGRSIEIYDDPSDMAGIWDMFYALAGQMRDRYTRLRADPTVINTMNDIWLLVDEANDLAIQLQAYYQREVRASGKDPAGAPVWLEAIGPLIWQGRQVRIRGTWAFQTFYERYAGGINLRPSFPVIGLAGFKPSQYRAIVGGTPVPRLQTGPGRVLMCRGADERWVQCFYDDPEWLRAWAEGGNGPDLDFRGGSPESATGSGGVRTVDVNG